MKVSDHHPSSSSPKYWLHYMMQEYLAEVGDSLYAERNFNTFTEEEKKRFDIYSIEQAKHNHDRMIKLLHDLDFNVWYILRGRGEYDAEIPDKLTTFKFARTLERNGFPYKQFLQ